MKQTLILLLTFLSLSLFGQRRYGPPPFFEAGVMLGGSNYLGDLSPNGFPIGESQFAFGVFGRYNPSKWFSIKFAINQGKIVGDDSRNPQDNIKRRNLSFRSQITEFALIPEFNILGWDPDAINNRFSPYVFAGIAVFTFNPQAQYEGVWYNLQPLGTEGQNIISNEFPAPYRLTQTSFPMGIGVKFALNSYWNIGLDMGMRYTNTDYLDDVSGSYVGRDELVGSSSRGELTANLANRTSGSGDYIDFPTGTVRGNPQNKDWYAFAGITISYNFLDGIGAFGPSGCPTF